MYRKKYVKKYKIILYCLFLLLVLDNNLFSEYPEIKLLNSDDLLFRQIQDDIEKYNIAAAVNDYERIPPLLIFKYNKEPDEDLFFLSARFNLPYDTLSTINGVDNKNDFNALETIIVPNLPGLFIPFEAKTDLEKIMISWRNIEDQILVTLLRDGSRISSYFIIGERFHSIERAYFLKILFRFPLPDGEITSLYGNREDPFTGHPNFHNGIDIAAPIGTDVLAARDGVVTTIDYDSGLGLYIIITHSGGYQTVYGHLNEVKVSLKLQVYSSMIIGSVGNTGYSTGPHLHFEIRKEGNSRDPMELFMGNVNDD